MKSLLACFYKSYQQFVRPVNDAMCHSRDNKYKVDLWSEQIHVDRQQIQHQIQIVSIIVHNLTEFCILKNK
jgi:hypothetical protein